MTATFKTPNNLALKSLAELTIVAVRLLEPWCGPDDDRLTTKSPALKAMSEQAKRYARAIDYSVTAAQKGFEVSEDALNLAEYLAHSSKSSASTLRKFAEGMIEAAQEAHDTASKSLDYFRDVRTELLGLIREARKSQQITEDLEGKLNQLENGIPVFENISESINMYIKWWSWLELTANGQVQNTKTLKLNYSSLRDKAIVAKWRELMQNFFDYNAKISEIQDRFPTMFSHVGGDAYERSDEVAFGTTSYTRKQLQLQKRSVWRSILFRGK